jgi:hypothetical protein
MRTLPGCCWFIDGTDSDLGAVSSTKESLLDPDWTQIFVLAFARPENAIAPLTISESNTPKLLQNQSQNGCGLYALR